MPKEADNEQSDAIIVPENLHELMREYGAQLHKKEKKYFFILIGVVSVFLVITILNFSYFKRQMGLLRNQMNNITSRVDAMEIYSLKENQKNSDIEIKFQQEDNSTANYDPKFQQQNSIVADYSYKVMNYDPKSGQITLHITATPKTLIEDMMAIFTATTTDMTIVEEEGTLAASNIFECRMMLPVQDEIRLSVNFKHNNEIQSQVLETIYQLKSSYQMKVSAQYKGNSRLNGSKLKIDGQVETHIIPAYGFINESGNRVPKNWPVSGIVKIIVNNELIKEEPIDLGGYFTEQDLIENNSLGECFFYTNVNEMISVSEDSVVQITAHIIDNFGVEHIQTIHLKE